MNLPKAIEIIETELPVYLANPETDLMKAISLGREALKWRLEIEKEDPDIELELLPGETEE